MKHLTMFQLEISLSGAAFEDSGEVSRILRRLADQVEIQVMPDDGGIAYNGGSWPLMDVNGQRVGTAWIQNVNSSEYE